MEPTLKVAKEFPDVRFESITGYKTAPNVSVVTGYCLAWRARGRGQGWGGSKFPIAVQTEVLARQRDIAVESLHPSNAKQAVLDNEGMR